MMLVVYRRKYLLNDIVLKVKTLRTNINYGTSSSQRLLYVNEISHVLVQFNHFQGTVTLLISRTNGRLKYVAKQSLKSPSYVEMPYTIRTKSLKYVTAKMKACN